MTNFKTVELGLYRVRLNRKIDFLQNTIPYGSTSHLHAHFIANDSCYCKYFIFGTSNFGAVAEELLVFVEICFLFELILFFY